MPKINNAILRKTLKNQQKEQKSTLKAPTFNEFQKNTSKNISFGSLLDLGVNASYLLENNSAVRLFATDTGVIAGRYYNAPNKYRKIIGMH